MGLTCILFQFPGKRLRETHSLQRRIDLSKPSSGLTVKEEDNGQQKQRHFVLCGGCQYIRHQIPFSYKKHMRTGSPDTSADISLKFL